MEVVKFAYYDDFHCAGPDCIDTCCKEWSIILSKKEYTEYKKTDFSPKVKDLMDKAFIRIRHKDDQNDSCYVEMRLNEKNECVFLGDDRLCMLQKEKGEKILSHTCSVFPRLKSMVGGEVIIYACSLTCPHVAEIMINTSEGLALTEEEYDGKDEYINQGRFSSIPTPKDWVGYPYYWTIKNAQIDILQDRRFTVPERMLILGFFCQKANDYINHKEGEKIAGLANMLLDEEMCRKVADSLKAPQSDASAATKSVDIIMKVKECINNINGVSQLILNNISILEKSIDLRVEKIGNGKNIEFHFDTEKYSKNLEIYRGIENSRPYIIENVLVNDVFMQPLNKGIWANYFTTAVFYNTLKVCIPAFLGENWTDRDLALAITNSAKLLLNTHIIEKGILLNFVDNQSFSLPHAAFLIS